MAAGAPRHPFPDRRPEIAVATSRAKPFAVDRRELPGFPVVPAVGARARMGFYDPPGWRLTGVTELRAVRPARVHETPCVEIEVVDHERGPRSRWTAQAWTMFARLTDEAVGWLATLKTAEDGAREVYTFRDEGFADDWGEAPRRVEDTGRLVQQDDGTWRLRHRPSGPPEDLGAGIFRVRIGDRAFTCLRSIDILTDGGRAPAEEWILYESYLTKAGRAVLGRRYNARLWGLGPASPHDGPPWDERLPGNARLVICGITFVHWYDVLSDAALAPGRPRKRRA